MLYGINRCQHLFALFCDVSFCILSFCSITRIAGSLISQLDFKPIVFNRFSVWNGTGLLRKRSIFSGLVFAKVFEWVLYQNIFGNIPCSLLDHYVDDFDVVVRFVVARIRLGKAHLLTNVHSLDNATEHCMLIVQPRLKKNKMIKYTG